MQYKSVFSLILLSCLVACSDPSTPTAVNISPPENQAPPLPTPETPNQPSEQKTKIAPEKEENPELTPDNKNNLSKSKFEPYIYPTNPDLIQQDDEYAQSESPLPDDIAEVKDFLCNNEKTEPGKLTIEDADKIFNWFSIHPKKMRQFMAPKIKIGDYNNRENKGTLISRDLYDGFRTIYVDYSTAFITQRADPKQKNIIYDYSHIINGINLAYNKFIVNLHQSDNMEGTGEDGWDYVKSPPWAYVFDYSYDTKCWSFTSEYR